jgi:hypothetical protein
MTNDHLSAACVDNPSAMREEPRFFRVTAPHGVDRLRRTTMCV